MRRRQFIAGLGSAAAWPLAARAQRAFPVVGVLIGGTAQPDGIGMAALRKGLSETGFVEGNNVEILHLGAEWQYDRLPALAAELVRRRGAAIFALWNVPVLVADMPRCTCWSAAGPGCVKTKSDLVVEDEFLRFFALSVTTSLKIQGAFMPHRVFTQPGP
jgi:hypothetical protein